MGYSIDLNTISIDEYKEKLENKTLIPSRRILKENLEERFSKLKKLGIKTAADLYNLLKDRNKLKELAEKKEFTEEYLTVLFRELKSIIAKPLKLSEFSWISAGIINKLVEVGIKNTAQVYEYALNEFNKQTGKIDADTEEMVMLIKQCDLTRIQWVNQTFARILYESGYDTVKKVADADPETLYNRIIEINQGNKYYKGKIGLNDMKICIEAAGEIEQEIEY